MSALKTTSSGDVALMNFAYQYDAVGNVQAITTTNTPTETRQFGYDALDRLTWANLITSSQTTTESYTYDAMGHWW